MLLSVQQKYILDTLRKLRAVRRRQLAVLVREKFQFVPETVEPRMNTMLRQLRMGTNDIFLDGDIIRLSGAQPNALCLEAIDVMLEISQGAPGDFTMYANRPELLRFSWGEDPRLFTVAELAAPIRPTVEGLERRKRVIWISGGGTDPEGLSLPPKHFFAVRQSDGFHRFYGSNGS